MTDSTSEEKNDNIPASGTRARRPNKIPANMVNPIDKSVTHLSRKQRSIIKRLPIAESMGAIADELHCSKGYVSQTFHLPAVQDYLRAQLEAAGATHGKIFQRIAEGLDATKEGKGATIDKETGQIKVTQIVDFAERREHAKLALKLEGYDTAPQDDKGDTITNNSIYNIVIQARQARGLDGK